MNHHAAVGGRDFLDLIRDVARNEVQRCLAEARAMIARFQELRDRENITVVTTRCHRHSVRITETLTGKLVAEYDRARAIAALESVLDAEELEERYGMDGERILAAEGALLLLGDTDRYLCPGDSYQDEVLDDAGIEDLRSDHVELENAIGDLLAHELHLPEEEFAALVGIPRADVRLARLYRAWENGHRDTLADPVPAAG